MRRSLLLRRLSFFTFRERRSFCDVVQRVAVLLLLSCVFSTIRIFSRITNLTFQARSTSLQNKYLYLNAVKRIINTFFCSVNHLNQQKSPSATLVSKTIEIDSVSSFFQKSREVPAADLSIVCGWGDWES